MKVLGMVTMVPQGLEREKGLRHSRSHRNCQLCLIAYQLGQNCPSDSRGDCRSPVLPKWPSVVCSLLFHTNDKNKFLPRILWGQDPLK